MCGILDCIVSGYKTCFPSLNLFRQRTKTNFRSLVGTSKRWWTLCCSRDYLIVKSILMHYSCIGLCNLCFEPWSLFSKLRSCFKFLFTPLLKGKPSLYLHSICPNSHYLFVYSNSGQSSLMNLLAKTSRFSAMIPATAKNPAFKFFPVSCTSLKTFIALFLAICTTPNRYLATSGSIKLMKDSHLWRTYCAAQSISHNLLYEIFFLSYNGTLRLHHFMLQPEALLH